MKKIQDYQIEQTNGKRTELINFLIDRFGYQRHLEIEWIVVKTLKR